MVVDDLGEHYHRVRLIPRGSLFQSAAVCLPGDGYRLRATRTVRRDEYRELHPTRRPASKPEGE